MTASKAATAAVYFLDAVSALSKLKTKSSALG
jgi:hypothetical protein